MNEAPPSRVSWGQLACLTIFALAFGIVINTVDPGVLGRKAVELTPDRKNTVLGLLTFAGLVLAMIWQPMVGSLSDRTRSPLGRRPPYWIGGALGVLLALAWLGAARTLVGLFAGICLLQLALNTIQAPWQALLPEQVPPAQHGAAAGFKSAFEILGFVVGRYLGGWLVAQGRVTPALCIAGICILVALAITLRASRAGATIPSLRSNSSLWPLHRPPGFAAWFGNRILVWGGFILLSTFLLFYAMDVFGLPEPDAQRLVARTLACHRRSAPGRDNSGGLALRSLWTTAAACRSRDSGGGRHRADSSLTLAQRRACRGACPRTGHRHFSEQQLGVADRPCPARFGGTLPGRRQHRHGRGERFGAAVGRPADRSAESLAGGFGQRLSGCVRPGPTGLHCRDAVAPGVSQYAPGAERTP